MSSYFTNQLVKKRMTSRIPARMQHERADQTRKRILEAAIEVFSEEGLAGARTEKIAAAARVNKALIYYYFHSKDELYNQALDAVAQQVVASSMATMNTGATAGERLVQYVLSHFDRIHSQQNFQGLMQQEMVRVHRGEKNALGSIVEKVFRPTMQRFWELIDEGQTAGELIQVDRWQLMNAALGANTFYFLSLPVSSQLTGLDLLAPEQLAQRRTAAVEYLGQTIFLDREHGRMVAARVLDANPMPPSGNLTRWRKLKGFEVKQK